MRSTAPSWIAQQAEREVHGGKKEGCSLTAQIAVYANNLSFLVVVLRGWSVREFIPYNLLPQPYSRDLRVRGTEVRVWTAVKGWESDETADQHLCVSLSSLYLPFLFLSPFLYLPFITSAICSALAGSKGALLSSSALHWRGKKRGLPVGQLCNENSAERWKAGKQGWVNQWVNQKPVGFGLSSYMVHLTFPSRLEVPLLKMALQTCTC